MLAALFDMDGLLIDSEPFWKVAEKEVYGAHGVTVTDDFLRKIEGSRLDEAIQFVHHHYPFPNPDFKRIEQEVIDTMCRIISENGKALPGVYETLELLQRESLPLALASSSPMRLIGTVIDKLNLNGVFQVVHSAQFEPYGKPHPGIFITTAASLQVPVLQCVVFEDSVNGVLAAKSARMKCIAVPDVHHYNDPRMAIADVKLSSLLDFNKEIMSAF